MAEAHALERGDVLSRMSPAFGFQVIVGGEAVSLATDTSDIIG